MRRKIEPPDVVMEILRQYLPAEHMPTREQVWDKMIAIYEMADRVTARSTITQQ
jgi:hypothetical protein